MYEPRSTIVHKSLLEVKTFLGVEARMAILNLTIAAALTMALQTPMLIPVAVIIHLCLRWTTKNDPHFLAIYRRFDLLGSVYDPWVHVKVRMNGRPDGFSKGMLC